MIYLALTLYTYRKELKQLAELRYRAKKMFSINKELVERLEKLSKQTRIPQSRLIDEAIEDLLKKHDKQKN